LFSCENSEKKPSLNPKEEVIIVEYPEVYELANIIIALTETGKTDRWKVNKGYAYYDETLRYFEKMKGHPLLDSVNYARMEWKPFLSFRTDAYAYEFDKNDQLVRKNDFHSFEISAFDDHIALVQDFAEKSNFRAFFKKQAPFCQQIIANYKKHYMIGEMMQFLEGEFDNFLANQKFKVVLSPFVGSQHLLREPDSLTTASFADIAKPIINNTTFLAEDKSTNLHTLFTEMDHAFVNPTTEEYPLKNFFKEELWSKNSGYEGYGTAVFNEYMTWAVFDFFNEQFFPEIAEKINLNWHFQNETRGFIYSNLFADQLKKLKKQYPEKRIKDLYPALLEWTKNKQIALSKPHLLNDSDTLSLSGKKGLIQLQFSEPMEKIATFEALFQFGPWDRKTIAITEKQQLLWQEDGKALSFELDFPEKEPFYLLFNWWGSEKPLKSQKGILLEASSGFVIN
jgi:hypothetical protein